MYTCNLKSVVYWLEIWTHNEHFSRWLKMIDFSNNENKVYMVRDGR